MSSVEKSFKYLVEKSYKYEVEKKAGSPIITPCSSGISVLGLWLFLLRLRDSIETEIRFRGKEMSLSCCFGLYYKLPKSDPSVVY